MAALSLLARKKRERKRWRVTKGRREGRGEAGVQKGNKTEGMMPKKKKKKKKKKI